jgi:hypothetical protein
MSGGKGGKEKSKQEVPEWVKEQSQYQTDRANTAAKIGYLPWMGPDVAAVNPLEEAAMRGAGAAGSAFGIGPEGDVMAGMPQAETFANGMSGYSSFPLYNEAIGKLREAAPGQMSEYDKLFTSNIPEGYEGPGDNDQYIDPNNLGHQVAVGNVMYDRNGGYTEPGDREAHAQGLLPDLEGYTSDPTYETQNFTPNNQQPGLLNGGGGGFTGGGSPEGFTGRTGFRY